MRIGDLVYRKKEVYSDKVLYLSDYSHDEEGNLVSTKDLVGVVLTRDRIHPSQARRKKGWDSYRRWPTEFPESESKEESSLTLVTDSKVWVAWTPEISSLEWTDDLKIFDEDDLDPFEGIEGD